MKKMKRIRILFLAAVLALTMAGCSTSGETQKASPDTAKSDMASGADVSEEVRDDSSDTSVSVTTPSDLDLTSMFTDRDSNPSWSVSGAVQIVLDGDRIDTRGGGVSVEGSAVRITSAGTYHLTGTMTDGQVIVDIPNPDDDDKVQLVLDNVDMTCSRSACILIKSGDKVFVTLAEGSTNVLSDTGAEYAQTDTTMNVDAVIFSKCDLVFNGSGSLSVTAGYQDGIVSKDDLKFTGGTYEIYTAGKGIVGKDSLRIKDGTFTVVSQDDALHTDNREKPGKGYLYIEGGTFHLTAGDDAANAATALVIRGGTFYLIDCYEGLKGDTVDVEGAEINQS